MSESLSSCVFFLPLPHFAVLSNNSGRARGDGSTGPSLSEEDASLTKIASGVAKKEQGRWGGSVISAAVRLPRRDKNKIVNS